MKKNKILRKSLSAILALAMLLGILAMLPITASATAPSGTADDPITVASVTDWNALSNTLASASNTRGVSYVVLTADLDFAGESVTPLSLESYSVHIEGNDHTISNYKASTGLIDVLGENSTVQNLHIVGATVSTSAAHVGALGGYAKDGLVMTNVTTDETTTVTNTKKHSTNSGAYVGGLFGGFSNSASNGDFVIRDCINRASVNSNAGIAGGIVGNIWNDYSHVTLQACENYGAVTGASYAGGLIGRIELCLNVTLKECLNNATISGSTAAGGLVGGNFGQTSGITDTRISYCVNKGAVTGTLYAGGIIGESKNAIYYSIQGYTGNEGTITSSKTNSYTYGYSGGILGYHKHSGTTLSSRHWIGACYNTGTIVAESRGTSGGILGSFAASSGTGVTISECYDASTHSIANPASGKHGLIAGNITGTDTSLDESGSADKILYFTRSHGVTSGSITKLFGGTTKINKLESCNNGNGVASLESNITTDYAGSTYVKFSTRLNAWKHNAQMRTPHGVGAKDDPYQIADHRNLLWLASNISSFDAVIHVILTGDINYGDYGINMNFGSKKLIFDGNGYTISNYTSSSGLFATVGTGSTIQNLNVNNATVTSSSPHAGAILGYANPGFTMINCSTGTGVTVKQTGSNAVGGLVGSFENSGDPFLVMNCTNNATVIGANAAGGIVGKPWAQNTDVYFVSCTNNGAVTASATGAGGIMAWAQRTRDLRFYNCVNNGVIKATGASTPAGGILGSVNASYGVSEQITLSMYGCRNRATVTSEGYNAGGMLGYGDLNKSVNKTWTFSSCSNTAAVTGKNNAGGIVGAGQGPISFDVDNCYNEGAIKMTSAPTSATVGAVGGILGHLAHGFSTVYNHSSFKNCYNKGALYYCATSAGSDEFPASGGIIGEYRTYGTTSPYQNTLTLENCYDYGAARTGASHATASRNAYGAICGMLASELKTVTLKSCYGVAVSGLSSTTKLVTQGPQGTQTNCGFVSAASLDDEIATIKTSADTAIDISTASQKLSVRIKLTDDFGLMAITEVAQGAKSLASYQEVGFYFAEIDGRFLPTDLFRDENRYVGGAYNGSSERFYATYTDLHAADLDRTIAFAAYVMDAEGNVAFSDVRMIEVKPIVEDLTDGKLGSITVTEKVEEMALYEAMLGYANAFTDYQSIDLRIGSFNLCQNAYDKTDALEDYSKASEATAAANIKKYAATMDALDLDVMGMNEVDIYRGSKSTWGGFNTPWEVAREMESRTGEQYYWAFATALDSSAKFANGSSVRGHYNRYANETNPANYPDGRWYSGDGGDARTANTAGYGEAVVSKYPIVGYSYKLIVPADYANGDPTYSKYTADYQYDPSNGYERRVILVVQLDVDGEIVTVMVTHLDHTGKTIPLAASVGAITELANTYKNTPAFLMGDLNVAKGSDTINSLDQVLNRSGNDNMTPTFMSGNKIDFIYYNDLVDLRSYRVDSRNDASDHLPVYVSVHITKKAFR